MQGRQPLHTGASGTCRIANPSSNHNSNPSSIRSLRSSSKTNSNT